MDRAIYLEYTRDLSIIKNKIKSNIISKLNTKLRVNIRLRENKKHLTNKLERI